MYKGQDMRMLKFGKSSFLREMETAVQNGNAVLI